jgi:hypothetical protein
METTLNLILGWHIVAFMAAMFLLPTIIVAARHRVAPGPTVVVNLFLGWTGIGWLVALAMALGDRRAVTS